jgi:hypothetical protein
MSNHYQYSVTYTLAGLWDDDPQPYAVDCTHETAQSWCTMGALPFKVAADLGGEYGLATSRPAPSYGVQPASSSCRTAFS